MKKEVLDQRIDITGVFSIDDGCTLDEALSDVTKAVNEVKRDHVIPNYHTKSIVHREEYGYDGGYQLHLNLWRLETDNECATRIERERVQQEAADRSRLKRLEKKWAKLESTEAIERAEYERLKSKYGN